MNPMQYVVSCIFHFKSMYYFNNCFSFFDYFDIKTKVPLYHNNIIKYANINIMSTLSFQSVILDVYDTKLLHLISQYMPNYFK